MGKIDGVVVGIVKGLDDPQKLGRIQLHFPWMSDDNKSHWARVATLMAGSGRGSWFQPELEDEVLVAFEHGNTQHPYIVGFLWNKQDKPPTNDIDGKVRRIQSVAGHVLDFDDRDARNAIRVTTAGGQQITLDDTKLSITLENKTHCTIEIKPDGITLDAGPGMLHVKCSMLDVQAPIATFSGVIQTQTIIAQSVIGTTYTPGLGNLI